MKKIFVLILLIYALTAFPCSIFKYSYNGKTFFCGNEDWSAKDPAIMTMRQTETHYGIVLLGWKSYLPHYPQAGINSHGLCFDWAVVPSQNYQFIQGKENLSINSTIEILKNCKDITDVLEYIEDYNFSHLAEEHIMFADREGNSCVIEYTKGERRILVNTSMSQYITNFNLTDPDAGWYPCPRYQTLETTLNTPGLDDNILVDILNRVHQEEAYPTIYSYIFNLEAMTVRIFYNHQYDTYQEYNINELIELDTTITIE
jgi:hypothetical protein